MNAQEIFDRAVSGVIAQGRPSVDSNGKCLYRGLNGSKCAVGWLIPDEKYDPEMDHESMDTSVQVIVKRFPDALSEFGAMTAEKLDLLVCLQDAHDTARGVASLSFEHDAFVVAFERMSRAAARRFGLSEAALE